MQKDLIQILEEYSREKWSRSARAAGGIAIFSQFLPAALVIGIPWLPSLYLYLAIPLVLISGWFGAHCSLRFEMKPIEDTLDACHDEQALEILSQMMRTRVAGYRSVAASVYQSATVVFAFFALLATVVVASIGVAITVVGTLLFQVFVSIGLVLFVSVAIPDVRAAFLAARGEQIEVRALLRIRSLRLENSDRI